MLAGPRFPCISFQFSTWMGFQENTVISSVFHCGCVFWDLSLVDTFRLNGTSYGTIEHKL